MKIRPKKCSRCSCLSAMKEIYYFKDNIPKNDQEAMALDEILCYGDLQGELFQCYMDNNGVKCAGLNEYVEFLNKNQSIEESMKDNLLKYKQGKNI